MHKVLHSICPLSSKKPLSENKDSKSIFPITFLYYLDLIWMCKIWWVQVLLAQSLAYHLSFSSKKPLSTNKDSKYIFPYHFSLLLGFGECVNLVSTSSFWYVREVSRSNQLQTRGHSYQLVLYLPPCVWNLFRFMGNLDKGLVGHKLLTSNLSSWVLSEWSLRASSKVVLVIRVVQYKSNQFQQLKFEVERESGPMHNLSLIK